MRAPCLCTRRMGGCRGRGARLTSLFVSSRITVSSFRIPIGPGGAFLVGRFEYRHRQGGETQMVRVRGWHAPTRPALLQLREGDVLGYALTRYLAQHNCSTTPDTISLPLTEFVKHGVGGGLLHDVEKRRRGLRKRKRGLGRGLVTLYRVYCAQVETQAARWRAVCVTVSFSRVPGCWRRWLKLHHSISRHGKQPCATRAVILRCCSLARRCRAWRLFLTRQWSGCGTASLERRDETGSKGGDLTGGVV